MTGARTYEGSYEDSYEGASLVVRRHDAARSDAPRDQKAATILQLMQDLSPDVASS